MEKAGRTPGGAAAVGVRSAVVVDIGEKQGRNNIPKPIVALILAISGRKANKGSCDFPIPITVRMWRVHLLRSCTP